VSKADGVDAESLFTFRSAVPPINLQLEFLGFRLNIPWIGGRYLCIRMHVPLGRLLKAVHLLLRNGEARPSHRGHALMRDRDHSPACACPSSHTETRLQGAAQFWKSDPATQARVLEALRETGAKSIVGHSWDDVTAPGWHRVRKSHYWIYPVSLRLRSLEFCVSQPELCDVRTSRSLNCSHVQARRFW